MQNKICLSSINISITIIHLPFVRILFFFPPQVYFPPLWLFLASTICSTRPNSTHDICSVEEEGKKKMKINKERRQHQKKNRRKAERRMTRRPLAVCFNSCVWCTLLNVKTVMGIREIGSSLPACLSCNFLVCDYYLTNVIGSGQKRHILSAIFLKPLESKDNKCEDDTNSATSTCLCCLKNSSAFISVRQMGSAF